MRALKYTDVQSKGVRGSLYHTHTIKHVFTSSGISATVSMQIQEQSYLQLAVARALASNQKKRLT